MAEGGHTRRRLLRLIAGGGFTLAFGKFLSGAGNQAWAVVQRAVVQPVRRRLPRQIRLSAKALEAPLRRGSGLESYRDFIGRMGPWRGYTTSVEQTVLVDGRVRLIGLNEPPAVGDILGFGRVDISSDAPFSVSNCNGQSMGGTSLDGDCDSNGCAGQHCDGQRCGQHHCDVTFSCNGQTCGTETFDPCTDMFSIGVVNDLEKYSEHPFIAELSEQLGVRDLDELVGAVSDFVKQNGYAIPGR